MLVSAERALGAHTAKLVNSVTEAASRPISMICNLASSILRSVSKLSASRVAGSKHAGYPCSPQIAFASALTSAVATTCCEARPCRSALRREFAFPELVRGPALLAALRRLALILSCELTFMMRAYGLALDPSLFMCGSPTYQHFLLSTRRQAQWVLL